MKLHNLTKTTSKKSKRLGRGYGSGVGGHTTTRGQKGQRSRSKIADWFEGGQLPQIRRFPFIRGKNRFKSLKKQTIEINLNSLNRFKANQTVDLKALVDTGLISQSELIQGQVKILGNGTLEKPLTVTLETSKKAQQKIEAAGGKVDRGQNS
jgi:large subunit ribosomal protein L15